MDVEKFTRLINKKFPNYDIADNVDEIYFDFRQNFVVGYMLFNDVDNKFVVFVGQGSTVYNHELFNNYNEADEYFKDCVKLFVK